MHTESLSLMVETSRDPDTLTVANLMALASRVAQETFGAFRSSCSFPHNLSDSLQHSLNDSSQQSVGHNVLASSQRATERAGPKGMVVRLQFLPRTIADMPAFRALLISMDLAPVGYTAVVIAGRGLGLLAVFIGNMQQMDWSGQFNLDFALMLMLSSLWVMWRHHFTSVGLVLGIGALLGGVLFLSTYLFIQSLRFNGKIVPLLIGPQRLAG